MSFYYVWGPVQEDILFFLLEHVTALGICTMVLGKNQVNIKRFNKKMSKNQNLKLNYSPCFFRLLGWWSIDKESQEEQARLYHDGASG